VFGIYLKTDGVTNLSKIFRIKDCSGSKFPRKRRLLEYVSPVKYYGKKVSKSRNNNCKEDKEKV
tara:strand:+ start:179 stop:370 length:192 start_codon:yes stop_codon:yes gene_type:complete